jgi:hypothetical protein
MPLSKDVTLPIDQTPKWPPLCILCGHNNPDSAFRFRAGRIGWDQLVTLSWAWGSRPRVEAPACAQCAKQLRRQRITRELITWLLLIPIIVGVVLLMFRVGWATGPMRPYRRWIAVAAVLIIYLPFQLWQSAHPPILDATAKGDTLDYEFADASYAMLFLEENM